MKQVALILTILFSSSLYAQDAGEFFSGARFAMGSAEFKATPESNEDDINHKLMFAAGFNANYFFTRSVGVGTDIMLNFLGSEANGVQEGGVGSSDREYKDKWSFIRLELPLLGKLAIPVAENFSLVGFGGPSFDFNLAGNYSRTFDDGNNNVDESIETLETISSSIKFGAGVMVKGKNGQIFMLDARVSRDLGPFFERKEDQNYRLGYFALSIGVGF